MQARENHSTLGTCSATWQLRDMFMVSQLPLTFQGRRPAQEKVALGLILLLLQQIPL
jgi:hypothetical protein